MDVKCAAIAFFAAGFALSAQAALVDVTGPLSWIRGQGPGQAARIIDAPADVFDDGAENVAMQGFNEAQNVTLSRDILTDWGFIAAGTRVSSHMIFLNSDGRTRVSHGSWRNPVSWIFDGDILGVMSDRSGALEFASTDLLGLSGVAYPDRAFRARGMFEGGADFLDYVDDQLDLAMTVTEPGDWIRVVTAAPDPVAPSDAGAVVPLPATGVLLLGGLAALGGLRRKG